MTSEEIRARAIAAEKRKKHEYYIANRDTILPKMREYNKRTRAERTVSERKCREAMSQSGNDMLVVKMKVSGQASSIWHYIAFLEDRPEITNRMLTQLFDSFGIEEGNFNLASYTGKAGGICVKHDEQGRAKISYLLNKRQQDELPPFDGEIPVPKTADGYITVPAGEDLPF